MGVSPFLNLFSFHPDLLGVPVPAGRVSQLCPVGETQICSGSGCFNAFKVKNFFYFFF